MEMNMILLQLCIACPIALLLILSALFEKRDKTDKVEQFIERCRATSQKRLTDEA